MDDDVTPAPERWLPIADWEGLYEASSYGRFRSLPRRTRTGIHGGGVLKLFPGAQGYYMVKLWRNGKSTTRMAHRLIAQTFLGPRPEGLEIRHLNDDKLDNRLVNLCYGTRSENKKDSVRNGIHPNTRQTHCKRGHEFTPENTYSPPGQPTHRVCIACTRSGIKPGAFNRNKTHCKRGHELNAENAYTKRDGGRDCRICRRERVRAREQEKREQAKRL
jgi:hypothetical protein